MIYFHAILIRAQQSVAQGGTYVVKAHNGLLPSGSLERLQAQVWPGMVSPNHIAWIWDGFRYLINKHGDFNQHGDILWVYIYILSI